MFSLQGQCVEPIGCPYVSGVNPNGLFGFIDNPACSGQEAAMGDDASDKMPFKVTLVSVNNNGKSTQIVALVFSENAVEE